MRSLIGLTMLVASCAPLALITSLPPSPSTVCNNTAIDEKIGVAFEEGYKAFRIVVETGVDLHLIKGNHAATLRDINTKLYNLTLVEQSAYKTCNATSYMKAISDGKETLAMAYKMLGN